MLFATLHLSTLNSKFCALLPPLLPLHCSTLCCLPYLEPLPLWCLASLTADWSGLSALLSPPSSSSCFGPFFPFLCLLSSWSVSVAVPDLSDRRLVRVVSAAPPPSPSPPPAWSLEEALAFLTADWLGLSGFSLPTTNHFSTAGALNLLAFGFSDRRLVRISVACVP